MADISISTTRKELEFAQTIATITADTNRKWENSAKSGNGFMRGKPYMWPVQNVVQCAGKHATGAKHVTDFKRGKTSD